MTTALHTFIYYALLLPISYLPFGILYKMSDLLYVVLYQLIGYRTQVVQENLSNAFPNKTAVELVKIEREFYRYFCDLLVETVKSFTISKKEIYKRMVITNPEVLNAFYNNNQSVAGIMGHYANWEWAGLVLNHFLKHHNVAIYKTVANTFWDEKIRNSRSKFGLELIDMRGVVPYLRKPTQAPFFMAFIADQSPSNTKTCYWQTFLNQETAILPGPEKLSAKYQLPVVFAANTRVARGYYEISFSVVHPKPNELPDGQLTQLHTQMLEQQINAQPAYWLWTHKRWKHKPTSHE